MPSPLAEPAQPVITTDSSQSIDHTTSLCEEIGRLSDEQRVFNLHLNVFKRLLNLKDVQQSDCNFFVPKAHLITTPTKSCKKGPTVSSHPLKSNIECSYPPIQPVIAERLVQLREQLLQSQLLVTCLVHNVQILRRRAQGPVVDSVGSGEQLRRLKNAHYAGLNSRAIFRYQCSEKRKCLRKLKAQLYQARQKCWRTVHWNLTDPTSSFEQTETSSCDSGLHSTCSTKTESEPIISQNVENALPIETSDQEKVNIQMTKDSVLVQQDCEQVNTEQIPQVVPNNHEEAAEKSRIANEKMRELMVAMDKRKDRLDKLENECRQFLERLEVRYSDAAEEHPTSELSEALDSHLVDMALILGSSDEDENEELNGLGFVRLDEMLITDDVEDEEDDSSESENSEIVPLREEDIQEVMDRTRSINLLDSRLRSSNAFIQTSNLEIDNVNRVLPSNSDAVISVEDIPIVHSMYQSSSRLSLRSERAIEEQLPMTLNSQDIEVQLDMTQRSPSPRLSQVAISNEPVAETGEPLQLCHLRRRAVEVLASRWRTERAFYEQRESELRAQLEQAQQTNKELKKQVRGSTSHLRGIQRRVMMLQVALLMLALGGLALAITTHNGQWRWIWW